MAIITAETSTTNFVRSYNFQNNYNTTTFKSINGKKYVTDYGNSYWSFTIQSAPVTLGDLKRKFLSVFNADYATTSTVTIENAEGKFNDESSGGSITVIADANIGATAFKAIGSSKTLKAGTLIQANNSGVSSIGGTSTPQFDKLNKTYMVTQDVTVTGSGNDVVNIFPPLIAPLNGLDINLTANVKVTPISDTVVTRTDQNGYYTYSRDVREVL